MAQNGISSLGTKQAKQEAKLDLAATKTGDTYSIDHLPARYIGNTPTPSENPLLTGRPWIGKMFDSPVITITSTPGSLTDGDTIAAADVTYTIDTAPVPDDATYTRGITVDGGAFQSLEGGDITVSDSEVIRHAVRVQHTATSTDSVEVSSPSTVQAGDSTSETWVITGHSITDAWTIKAGSGNNGTEDMAAADGITYSETLQSGPYASAEFRYANRTTLDGVNLQAALDAGGDYLVGIEAMDDTDGLNLVNDFGNPPASAYAAALDWHEAAETAGFTEHFYVRWYGSNTSHGGFNQSWRDQITDREWDRWDGIKTYVDANKSGSLPFTWVYLDAAFAVLFDRIQDGTYTEFAIGDFFTDNVHCDTNLGHWLAAVFVWCSIRGTDPDTYGLQLGDMSDSITSAQKAELVDLIRDVISDPTLAQISTPATVPAQMSAPVVTSTGENSISVDRDAAPADGGEPITSYDLRWSTDETNWTTVTGISDPETISGLTASTLYYVQTRAVNSIGAGAWSTSGSVTTDSASSTVDTDTFFVSRSSPPAFFLNGNADDTGGHDKAVYAVRIRSYSSNTSYDPILTMSGVFEMQHVGWRGTPNIRLSGGPNQDYGVGAEGNTLSILINVDLASGLAGSSAVHVQIYDTTSNMVRTFTTATAPALADVIVPNFVPNDGEQSGLLWVTGNASSSINNTTFSDFFAADGSWQDPIPYAEAATDLYIDPKLSIAELNSNVTSGHYANPGTGPDIGIEGGNSVFTSR